MSRSASGTNSIAAITLATDVAAARITPPSSSEVGAPAATPVAVTATLDTAAMMSIHRYDWSRRRLERTASAAVAPAAIMTGSAAGVL